MKSFYSVLKALGRQKLEGKKDTLFFLTCLPSCLHFIRGTSNCFKVIGNFIPEENLLVLDLIRFNGCAALFVTL